MILRIEYGKAAIYYSDRTKTPTPEYLEDVLRRMERSLNRVWVGNAPAEVDLDEFEASTHEGDD